MHALTTASNPKCRGQRLPESLKEHVPFIIWNDILHPVVGFESLVVHVRLLEEICAVDILLLRPTTTNGVEPFLHSNIMRYVYHSNQRRA